MDFKDWLSDILNECVLSDLDVQRKTGINRSLIWHYKQGTKKPSFQNVGLLADIIATMKGKKEVLSHKQIYMLRLELMFQMYQMLGGSNVD